MVLSREVREGLGVCLVYVTLGLCKTNKEMPLCPPFLLAHMFVGLEPSTCTLLSHSWKLEGAPRVDYGCPGLTHQALGHQRSHLISLITHRARVDSGVWSLPPSNLHHRDQQCPPAVWGKAASIGYLVLNVNRGLKPLAHP